MRRHIRQAVAQDVERLAALDPLAATDPARRAQIGSAVTAQQCWLACDASAPDVPLGYGCLDRHFFGEWFIALVVVANAARRTGVGRQIITHLERIPVTAKIFTSTNTSNTPMRQLLAQLDYQASGVIENLDPGDPELIFVKHLK